MKITRIVRRGRTIKISGSFQPADLQTVLDLANTGQLALTPEPAPERPPLLADIDVPGDGTLLDAAELGD
jgi:hypothetical protein